jgi:hypothetical protein
MESGGGQRRLSTASNAALNQLASFELTLGGLESDVARISLSLSSDAGDDELGPLRADIAATHGAVEKLQMNNLDSVMTGHLVSGKDDAKGARKSLTQRAEALVSQLVALNGAAANAAAAAAFAAASPASGATAAPPAAPTTAAAPALLPLNDGRGAIPQVGLGTFQATAAGEVKAAVKAAVEAGYRLIDCAAGSTLRSPLKSHHGRGRGRGGGGGGGGGGGRGGQLRWHVQKRHSFSFASVSSLGPGWCIALART